MTKEDAVLYIIEAFKQLPVDMTQKKAEQLYAYYEYLVEINQVMNLTAITEFEQVVQKHFVDSIMMSWGLYDKDEEKKLIDVGTGAGFPGLPLKIIYPNLHVTLLDSLNKRINFLNQLIEKLNLQNIETVHGRAEEIARKKEYREQYDYAVSRAVANLATLSEYCIPFVKKDGYFIAYKSGEVKEELSNSLRAIHIVGGKLEKEEYYQLPDSTIERSYIKIKKVSNSSFKYPRRAGLPSKEPL